MPWWRCASGSLSETAGWSSRGCSALTTWRWPGKFRALRLNKKYWIKCFYGSFYKFFFFKDMVSILCQDIPVSLSTELNWSILPFYHPPSHLAPWNMKKKPWLGIFWIYLFHSPFMFILIFFADTGLYACCWNTKTPLTPCCYARPWYVLVH